MIKKTQFSGDFHSIYHFALDRKDELQLTYLHTGSGKTTPKQICVCKD